MNPKTCPQCGCQFGPGKTAANFKRQKHCGVACAHASRKFTPEQAASAFWKRVDKTAANGCWVYQGCRDKWGYAHVGVEHRRIQAHRYAYQLKAGPIPAGQLVMHACDNPPCVNPAHLRLGTLTENRLDCSHKGRDSTAVLKADQVREIRAALAKGAKQYELADKYSVARGVINRVAVGRSYLWVK